jgi:hypothetical protein
MPTMMTDDAILARIRAKKAARSRNRNRSSGPFRKVLQKLLGKYMKAGGVYPMKDIEVFIEKTGKSFVWAGPVTTYGVREGYLDRVARGQYRVTGKPIADL